jgi:hypothetical protein
LRTYSVDNFWFSRSDAVTKLPADEREECQELWADVAAQSKKAGDVK